MRATLLYDNTTTPTFDTVFYFSGPYTALGDQVELISPGTASQAEVELFNGGDAGTFDAELDFFDVGSPVGAPLGSFDLTDISSVGSDVIDLTIDLGAGLPVPEDLIFTVSVSNMSPNMDLGVDMFEPPTVGSSDNSFMIAESGGVYSQLVTNSENVYFQLSGTASVSTPEASSLTLLEIGLLMMGIAAWVKGSLAALRIWENPPLAMAFFNRASPPCAPNAKPTSWDFDAGVHRNVDAEIKHAANRV
jgi:hypothetical protein